MTPLENISPKLEPAAGLPDLEHPKPEHPNKPEPQLLPDGVRRERKNKLKRAWHSRTKDQTRDVRNKYARELYHRNKHRNREKLRARWRAHYHLNKDKLKIKMAEYRKNNQPLIRMHSRRKQLKAFGISESDYESMMQKQNGVCAICKKTCKTGRRLAIDHCHSSGAVRGLLCGNCNNGIGLFAESKALLLCAIEYLNPTPNAH